MRLKMVKIKGKTNFKKEEKKEEIKNKGEREIVQ